MKKRYEVLFIEDCILRRKVEELDGHNFYIFGRYQVHILVTHETGDWYEFNLTIPGGFATDLMSIPRGFRNLISKLDGVEASVIHDFLYSTHAMERKAADRILYSALKRSKISRFKAFIAYHCGVKPFGWYVYNNKTDLDRYDIHECLMLIDHGTATDLDEAMEYEEENA